MQAQLHDESWSGSLLITCVRRLNVRPHLLIIFSTARVATAAPSRCRPLVSHPGFKHHTCHVRWRDATVAHQDSSHKHSCTV